MHRAHPSHEDVFSVVGGLELNRNTSARDLPAETSEACVMTASHSQSLAVHIAVLPVLNNRAIDYGSVTFSSLVLCLCCALMSANNKAHSPTPRACWGVSEWALLCSHQLLIRRRCMHHC